MYRYIRTQSDRQGCQALTIRHDGRAYVPVFQHTAIDQDRPVGERETFQEHTHDLYHFVLYTRPAGQYLRNGQWHDVTPGTLVIVSPGEPHDFVTRQGSSVYSEITFSLETAGGQVLTLPFERVLGLYTGADLILSSHTCLSAQTAHDIGVLMIQITDYLQSRSSLSAYQVARVLARLMDIIIGHCCSERRLEDSPQVDPRMDQVRRHIEEHYMTSITADELADLAHMSKRQLFRAFGRAYRTSPLAYQQSLRLEAARTLLRSTRLRCNQIAHRVGYDDVYYFHRLFKRKLGMTPGQYRRSIGPNPRDRSTRPLRKTHTS